jgi:hypothetical protein
MVILEVVGHRRSVFVLGPRYRPGLSVIIHPLSPLIRSVIVVINVVVCHQPSRDRESIGGGRRQESTTAEFEFGLLIRARVAEMTPSVTTCHLCEVFSQDCAR